MALGLVKGYLQGFSEGQYQTSYYNTRNGEYTNEMIVAVDSNDNMDIPDFPEMDAPWEDFVLLIKKM